MWVFGFTPVFLFLLKKKYAAQYKILGFEFLYRDIVFIFVFWFCFCVWPLFMCVFTAVFLSLFHFCMQYHSCILCSCVLFT